MKNMSVLIKPASGMCNMMCKYCFYMEEIENRTIKHYGMMSYGTMNNIIRKCIAEAENMICFCFQGGEPTLRGIDFFREFIRLEQEHNKKNVRIFNALQTNGYAIDETWCRFLHDNKFLVGLSVDGTAFLHNKYRQDKNGGNTYRAIRKTATLFDEYSVDYNVLTVVNKDTVQYAKEIYLHYKENGWRYMQFIPYIPRIGNLTGEEDFRPAGGDYGKFLCELFDLWYEDFLSGEPTHIRYFENLMGILRGYAPESCDMRGVCSVQHVIEADGSVYPCDFYVMDDYQLGNINVNTITEIECKRREMHFIENSARIGEECYSCKYYVLCRGGCQRYRTRQDSIETYKNYLCEDYKIFYAHMLNKMRWVI